MFIARIDDAVSVRPSSNITVITTSTRMIGPLNMTSLPAYYRICALRPMAATTAVTNR